MHQQQHIARGGRATDTERARSTTKAVSVVVAACWLPVEVQCQLCLGSAD
jgi:hypothetical protein